MLLCWPYPTSDDELFRQGLGRRGGVNDDLELIKGKRLAWHLNSGARNHHNFTNMTLFALSMRIGLGR